ncbi:chromosome segregation protein SMC [Emcibacter nanhaiensis]|uniref:Chromosome partition protein Smc n=1 Tax=Emcibacter nanhaiensis TaxID=1505037 RepID=A0A501PBP5_9PROT|nr:chromosome segregation protein SMC [Emcibacter nanhaiensis]TPD57655.1 chromosome segregation protein SMC [Emcibacter nanhaiensis]
MDFTRLRLSGFKSFVDPTELVIEKGLTGVVGPNGCGKSNLLEALRWVMGENSAKSMRGSGMDDVIFAGTDSRPARNLAEVTLSLDNADRTAPSAFNDELQMEISRRIERESGSAYRLNGKDVRAKDVQLLFADASTGAHSPSLVSQGRIGTLINAKPKQRRAVLEEAAGISGLHSRRKEAESKLRSAENNLERLGDVEIQLQDQIRSLKNQARQATRFKNVSGEIRTLQALILYMEWRSIDDNMSKAEGEAREVLKLVSEVSTELGRLNKEQAVLSARLPELRQKEAEIAAKLHRMTVQRDGLDGEEQRLHETQEKLKGQLEHIDQDEDREKSVIGDAAGTIERLTAEKQQIRQEIENQTDSVDQLSEELKTRQAATLEAEWKLEELTQKQAQRNAEKNNLLRDIEEAETRLANLTEQKETIEERISHLESNNLFTRALSDAENRLSEAEQAVHVQRGKSTEAEDARQEWQQKEQDARSILQAHESKQAKLHAEIEALEELLSSSSDKDVVTLLEKITVTEGFETALGAALDMDLEASEDEEDAVHWQNLPAFESAQSLPAGVKSLAGHVNAPAVLNRRLSQIGLVDSADEALRLMKDLKPGQRLVTRAGGVWRWDGLCRSPEAPGVAAIRLSQKNRLEKVREELARKQQETHEARTELHQMQEKLEQAKQAAREIRQTWREAEEKAAAARRELTEAEKQATRHQSEESALRDRLGHMVEAFDEVEGRRRQAKEALAALPEPVSLENDIAEARRIVEEKRHELSEARLAHDSFLSRSSARHERLDRIETELGAWKLRVKDVEDHLNALIERRAKAREELAALEDRPGQIVEERRKLNSLIEEAEEARQTAAQVLAEAEEALATKDREIREVQARLAEQREQKVRLETSLEQYESQKEALLRRIDEEFNCQPGALREKAGLEPEQEFPDADDCHRKLERLKGERERLGAVNLRAEEELVEIEQALNNSVSEREDLELAIGKLMKAISDLNREGRARMLKAFDEVNAHFSELFTTLFGGGRAHLELTESDDPLDAGLEIMASPPGKKMQNLGLLSGGEQALTALSLIFAVFMTNPSPICVLDEVDAPLDDANVERFCDLLDEMNAKTSTRFLIVTHNAVTMSRMSRLFGVTMAERGVSQLVSVDLESAERMRDRLADSLLG